MGNSGRWIKSLINPKKSQKEKEGKGLKWKLWRTQSGGHVSASEGASDCSSDVGAAFNAAVAAVVRAPVKDFMEVRREWAALRIQAVFRAFLARRALRALKAVVRLQAIFRGRQVRKKADVTLKCMQALVRVQARVRAQTCAQTQPDLSSLSLDTSNIQFDPTKLNEDQWCNSPGTIEEVRTKLQMRHQGAVKRERAIAYAMSKQQLRACSSTNSGNNKLVGSHKSDKNGIGGSWVDRWMASKPWESRSIDEINSDQSEPTRVQKKQEDCLMGSRASFSELDSMKVRRNNISTRISAKPPCTEGLHDESSESTSSTKIEDSSCHRKPNYMNPTKSIKAKQRTTPHSSHNYSNKLMQSSSNSGSDLYPPQMHLDRYEFVKSTRE